ncbi:MAG: hypothetical protein DIZ80_00885 [endosymbiont of Galathealinum brachiosum]|uniref:F5/8 type C domain-containing protein n=1 Tax=endosymbiont of Galathealinum brachiosum TaxID=2200906 RepID=A0A370DP29_9GAMM|nr:MAG: hypothetical protein DIZ80_00885 [endosymbiont of Galathealinum brachiosum]
MIKQTLLAAGFISMAFTGSISANEYITGDIGDSWNFSDDSSDSITQSYYDWKKHENFSSMGEMWVHASRWDNDITVWTPGTGTQNFVNLDAAVDTIQNVSDSICSNGQTTVVSRGSEVITDAGTFTDTVGVSCGSYTTLYFAKNIGFIKSATVYPCFAAPCPEIGSALISSSLLGSTVPPSTDNIALNALVEVKQSNQRYGTANMNDGDETTYWRSGVMDNDQSINMRLGWQTLQTMSTIEIEWIPAEHARELTVWTYDGTDWVFQNTVYPDDTTTIINLNGDISANYIYLDLRDSYDRYFGIKEIVVK